MIILLFIESRLNFKNIPLNLTFKSSINYEYIVYRNENPISCFLEFLVSLMLLYSSGRFFLSRKCSVQNNINCAGKNKHVVIDCGIVALNNSQH